MLNPDGVIVGNYRTSLAGVDLNRVYKRPIEVGHACMHGVCSHLLCIFAVQNLFPTIYHTKSMVAAFMEEREVQHTPLTVSALWLLVLFPVLS